MRNDEKIKGASAYLLGPFSGIYLLLTEKKNGFIRFHAMQSVLVFGFVFLLEVVIELIPTTGITISYLLFPLINSLLFVFWIILIVKAYNGEKYKVYYFGDLVEKQLEKPAK